MVISVTQNVTIATALPAKAAVILTSKQALLGPRAGKKTCLQINLILASRVYNSKKSPVSLNSQD